MDQPHAVIDYDGGNYRTDFWEGQGRDYEDLAERIALKRLLPERGGCIAEIGAGFGRLVDLYQGYERIILLDYNKNGLREAQARLGRGGKYLYVAADLYRLPLAAHSCDTIVTVRVLHHIEDIPAALKGIATALRSGGAYVLEYANKRNLKSIARYLAGRQRWSPFTPEPYEFVRLNFDFHPAYMAEHLSVAGFTVEDTLSVSHFRHPLVKRLVPARTLAALDGALQRPGAGIKLTPSIFLRARTTGAAAPDAVALFRCPSCLSEAWTDQADGLECGGCGAFWALDDGIYDFKTPQRAGVRELHNT